MRVRKGGIDTTRQRDSADVISEKFCCHFHVMRYNIVVDTLSRVFKKIGNRKNSRETGFIFLQEVDYAYVIATSSSVMVAGV
jgi:hypothetical protein